MKKIVFAILISISVAMIPLQSFAETKIIIQNLEVFDTVYSFRSLPNHTWTERDRLTFQTTTTAKCVVTDVLTGERTKRDVWCDTSALTALQGNLLLNTIQSNENQDNYSVLLAFRIPEKFMAELDGTNTTYRPQNVGRIYFSFFQTTFSFSTKFTVNNDYDRVKGSTYPFAYAYKADGGLAGYDDIGFIVNIELFNSLFLVDNSFRGYKLDNYLHDNNIYLSERDRFDLISGLQPFISVCEYTAKNGNSWIVQSTDAADIMLNFFCIAALGREFKFSEWGTNTPSVNITDTELEFFGNATVFYNPYVEQWNQSPSFLPDINPFNVFSELDLSSTKINEFWNTLLANRFLYISLAFMSVGIIFVALTRGD